MRWRASHLLECGAIAPLWVSGHTSCPHLTRRALTVSGFISSTDHQGRQFWVVAAEREDGGRFIVRADEELTAFAELEAEILGEAVQKPY